MEKEAKSEKLEEKKSHKILHIIIIVILICILIFVNSFVGLINSLCIPIQLKLIIEGANNVKYFSISF